MDVLRKSAKIHRVTVTDILVDAIRYRVKNYDRDPYLKTRHSRLDIEFKRIAAEAIANTKMIMDMAQEIGVDLDDNTDDTDFEDMNFDELIESADRDFSQLLADMKPFM